MKNKQHHSSLFLPLAIAMVLGLNLYPIRLSPAQTLKLSENLVPLNSEQGTVLLRQSRAQADFIPLMTHFVTQVNQAFCGVASLAMVLNALGVEAPDAAAWEQNYFTQENVLNAKTEAIIPRGLIERQGLTLAELAEIFASHGVAVEVHYGSDLDLARFRTLAIANLQNPENFIVINYLRSAIQQERGGHISPLAAYDAVSDRFLILDVSRYKYPPVWVKATELWSALNSRDRTSGKTRGLVVVQRSSGSTPNQP